MKELLTKDFGVKVWNIYPDTQNNSLLVELRDELTKEVQFYRVDTLTFQLQEIELPSEESWWMGIIDYFEGVILYHTYLDGVEPVPEGVYGYAITRKKEVFSLEKGQFIERVGVTISVKQADDIQYYNILSGEPVIELENISNGPLADQLAKPIYYLPESNYYADIKRSVGQLTKFDCEGVIEYLEYEDYVVLSFYVSEKGVFTNHLFVVNPEGETVFSTVLAQGMEGIGMNTFFFLNNQLWFTRNKTILNSILIS